MQPLRVWQLHPCIASYLMCLDTCYWLELAAPLFRSFSHLGSAALCESLSYYVYTPICFLLFFMNQNDWCCFRCSSFSNVHISFPMFGPSSGYDILVILHCEATCFRRHRAAAAGERHGVLPSTSKVCDQGSQGFGREWVGLNTLGWDFLLDDFNLNIS